jgi:hypothetical protein
VQARMHSLAVDKVGAAPGQALRTHARAAEVASRLLGKAEAWHVSSDSRMWGVYCAASFPRAWLDVACMHACADTLSGAALLGLCARGGTDRCRHPPRGPARRHPHLPHGWAGSLPGRGLWGPRLDAAAQPTCDKGQSWVVYSWVPYSCLVRGQGRAWLKGGILALW